MKKRKTVDTELGRLPACAGQFIKLIIKKMRYRKKVRADVMAELAAHFEDELKEYATDEQKEQKARQLIEQFGDAKLLAVLLRRAKKRCRPLWRTVVARTFQTIGLLILCLIIYMAWFLTGKPVVSVDYLVIINQMNRPQLAEEYNGWPHYEKAIKLFVEAGEELKDRSVFRDYREIRSFAELAEQEKEEIKKWVQQNESAWREFVKASQKPYCYRRAEYGSRNEDKWLNSIILPELSTLRKLSKLGIWRSRIAVEQSRIKQGLKDCLTVIRTGRFWQERKTSIVEQLSGIGIGSLGHNEILHILESEDITADDLRVIQEQLSRIYTDGYPLMNMEGEKLVFMDIVQHAFTDGGLGGGHLIPERMAWIIRNFLDGSRKDLGVKETLLFTGPAMYHVGRDKTVRKANEIHEKLSAMTKMTPYQKHINEVKSEDIILSVRRRRYFLIWVFMPALDNASEFTFRTKALHEATLTVLALKRWRLERGDYPDSLAQLVSAGYLKALPMDPFSDEQLVYKKTADDFRLYSCGADFDDDGGVENPKDSWERRQEGPGDVVFWPVQKN